MIYKERSNGREHGTVYTGGDTVSFMLDQIGYVPEKDLSAVSVLEPCGGNGAFFIACASRLLESSKKHGFSFADAIVDNFAVAEIDGTKMSELKANLDRFLEENGVVVPGIDSVLFTGDFLTMEFDQRFDVVIGNPPYIRYDHIPVGAREMYKSMFPTFKGRCDMYVPFYEKGLRLLKEGGKLCYVCSNRWLKSDYGAGLREFVSERYKLVRIVNLEHVQVFEEEVIAYPAITLIENARGDGKTEYYDVFDKSAIKSGSLGGGHSPNGVTFALLEGVSGKNWGFGTIRHPTFKPIEEQGFKIGIGPATGADKVFISKDLKDQVESEALVPLVTSRDLRGNRLNWSGNHLINPFSEDGDLIDLESYPKLNGYFSKHREKLANRHVSKKNPGKWYRTIDKIKVGVVREKKLMIPDTSSNEIILMDEGNFLPHHNLVYITHPNGDERALKVLGAILSSDFGKEQMRKAGNLMNGGFIRWQIQNLKKIHLPDMGCLADTDIDAIVESYDKQDVSAINSSLRSVLTAMGTPT